MNNNVTPNTSSGNSATTGELASFDVAIDKTAAEPTDVASAYYPDEEDMLENNDFSTEVAIDLSNPVSKTVDGVEITVNGSHVTANHGSEKKVCYVVSGSTTNGSLTILGEKKYAVKLNGVSITNPDSAALNLLSNKRAFVILADGTTNTLTDGVGGSQKGTLYCKGKLLFNGSGSLSVTGNTNNGIHSADYITFSKGCNIYVKATENHGVKANDGIFINGGILNIEVSAAAAKGINSESHIIINGGRTTVLTTGNGAYDTTDKSVKGAACIKTDSTLTVNGGELWLKSTGSGGKGINVDMEANFNGGSVYVVTTGGQYKINNDSSSPKGIKVDGNINISGGRIWVRTSGYNGEGIETKKQMTITGGEVASYAYDDAINSKSNMTITGGYVYAQGQHNDGLDANGNCYIKGGTIFAICSGTPEVAIDANTEGGYKLYVTGGTIVAVGGVENGSSLSQSCYQASSWSASTWYALTVGSSTFSFKTPSSGGSGLVVSGASQPTLLSGVSVCDGTSYFGGLGIYGGTVSGGTNISLSSYSGGNGMNSGPGGWH
ncbi:carbohydrate-binding domain-containing protein [Prevotella communis]|uniref:carbohydrate-binding domain-containing protein n=1 Tax=Prevotella communis TaxID=2913614 RepID=UPI001EDC3D04|nr:carbohydrate-binding domain-containing protein [Prevotella communis]UKK68305.1 carbohydrate-binding domain-containing protein [Prevotella communis]UKK69560.1 carbohydrate-binding domain-containing protein [Prevotella communis]